MNINDESTKSLMVDLEAKEEHCFVVITAGSTQLYDYPGFGIRGFVRKTLRSLPNVRPPIYEKVKYELADDKVTRLEEYQNSLEPADQGTVYMQDLESALYYMVNKEASAKTEYTEDEDQTIRSLIKILGPLIIFVRNLCWWARKTDVRTFAHCSSFSLKSSWLEAKPF